MYKFVRNRRSDTRTDKIAIVSYPGKIHSKVGNNHVPILHTAQHKKSFRTPDNCRACPCKLWKKRNKVKKFFNTRQTTKYHFAFPTPSYVMKDYKCATYLLLKKIELWTSTNKTKQKIVTVNRASLSFLFLKKVAIVDKEIKI